MWDKLPNALNDTQKENKIRNILSSMKKKEIIEPDSPNQQKSNWVLKNKGLSVNNSPFLLNGILI